MDELEHEWSAGDDALTAREEVTTYNPTIRKPGVNCGGPETTDSQLTFRGRWTFLQTGFRPFKRQN